MSETEMLRRLRLSSNLAYFFSVIFVAAGIGIFWLSQNSASPVNLSYFEIVSGALFWAAIGFGIRRKSRVAAVLALANVGAGIGLAFYLQATAADPINPATLLIALLAIMLLVSLWNATRAAFAYHRLKKKDDPTYRATKTWHLATAVPALLLVTLISGYIGGEATGFFDHSRVITGNELTGELIDELVRSEAIAPNEPIHLVYAPVPFSVFDEGYLVTNKQFVAYEAGGPFGSLYIFQIPLSDVASVSIVSRGGLFANTLADIVLADGSEFQIGLPVANGGDTAFLDQLASQSSAVGSRSF